MLQDHTTARVLARLGDLENYPEEHLAPYQEFRIGGKTYYFIPGGFLYRKDPGGSEEVGGYVCGYRTDEVWNHQTDEASREGGATK